MKNIQIKIEQRAAKVGIIGLGYVGLPLAIRFSQEGFPVIGIDINEDYVSKINNGISTIKHISNQTINKIKESGFIATADQSIIKSLDIIIICVPTPLGIHNEPNMEFIESTLLSIRKHIRSKQLLILESTTYPGTTEEYIIPIIEDCNFVIGRDYFIGYSPEREDPGNKSYSTKTIPKIVSGYTESCLLLTKTLYDQIIDLTISVSSPKVAEMTKIVENIHRAVNIGLMNELKMLSDKMDIDIYEVIEAAKTKPFGFTPFYPGPGLGGHCIPIDPFYLTWKAKEYGMNTRFIELAGEINTSMPNYVIQKVNDALNQVGKSINNSKILVLGIAYKKNIDDIRESPSLEIISRLIDLGAIVLYNDPYCAEVPNTRKYNLTLKSTPLDKNIINKCDIVILCTDHDIYDYKMIESKAKILVDTRGRYKNNKKIVKA